ncbi:GIY-YIG nuclease family protein, partial [Campylobacter jejuni]|uniref:GIY-YIG nuclease family protein n=1 Tax=Campylobacter jejuni TaxID=197 RepID=UPI003C6CC67E
MGIIYLINAKGTTKYKIGFSEINVLQRLKGLQTGSPFELELIAQQPGTKETERKLH